ncbi:hypothetical protein HNQ93_000050 [Hymenobacter luteus]|uniref:Glycosyltransferase subfamily 4-like N-terminal domain-containing protein n=2 Tax=Hymenobacter TaxID=89966 RepID=A0A7W9SWL4_9BACT|nr:MULTISPECIES: glycosyltransferase [Hymenobacter]MBB4600470.1 hypothetical protein [Hymenobacter latericoloratus]MBB6057220.1 hypothetical protein [Hymenobacter luteus]
MISAPFSVLLLGWDEAPRTGELSAPGIRSLVQALAPRLPLSVMVPRLPHPPFATLPTTRLTALAALTPAEAAAPRPRPDQRPGAWQRPAAPYLGAAEVAAADSGPTSYLAASDGTWQSPAAPYLGATPASASLPVDLTIAVLPEASPAAAQMEASADFPTPAAAPDPTPVTELSASELLLNEDEFAGEAVEPDATEAADLTTEPTPPPVTPPQLATLPEALASLAEEQPAAADLNFQVIQYARFATRRALLEDFSVIYAADWTTWLAAMEIRQQTGRPLVLHVHSLAQDRTTPADRGWALALERLALRRADVVLAATEQVAERLLSCYAYLAPRLQVLDPADTETLHTTLHQLGNGLPVRQLPSPFFSPTA